MRKYILILLLLAMPGLLGMRIISPGGDQYISSQQESEPVAMAGSGARDQMVDLTQGAYTIRYDCADGLEIRLLSNRGVELERFETSGRADGGLGWYVHNSGWHTLAVSGGGHWRVSMEKGTYHPPVVRQAPPPAPDPAPTQRVKAKPATVERDDLDRSGVEWPQSRARWRGKRDEITKAYGFPAGQYILEYQYTGGGHFAIWIHSRRGVKDLLVNRIGKLYDKLDIPLPKDDVIWFEVESTFGNWEITLERKR